MWTILATLIASLILCDVSRADFQEISRTYVDIEPASADGPMQYDALPGQVIGAEAPFALTHEFAALIGYRVTAPVTDVTINGSLIHIGHVTAGGRDPGPDYSDLGIAAGFHLAFDLAQAPASSSSEDVGMAILDARTLGTAIVGNGLPLGGAHTILPPDFSVDLGPEAVAAANAAFLAGRPFYLAIAGSGFRAAADSGLQGQLADLSLVPEPASWALMGAGLVGVVIVRRRRVHQW